MHTTDDVFARFTSRDPLLLAALRCGDPAIGAAVARLLRMTPLSLLARQPAALVDVLAALPEVHARLRGGWARQDSRLDAQLSVWVEQARQRTQRDADRHSRADQVAAAVGAPAMTAA